MLFSIRSARGAGVQMVVFSGNVEVLRSKGVSGDAADIIYNLPYRRSHCAVVQVVSFLRRKKVSGP